MPDSIAVLVAPSSTNSESNEGIDVSDSTSVVVSRRSPGPLGITGTLGVPIVLGVVGIGGTMGIVLDMREVLGTVRSMIGVACIEGILGLMVVAVEPRSV